MKTVAAVSASSQSTGRRLQRLARSQRAGHHPVSRVSSSLRGVLPVTCTAQDLSPSAFQPEQAPTPQRKVSVVGGSLAATAFKSSSPRNLVVAIDNSLDAWTAVKWTLETMYCPGDTLHLVHVIPQGFTSVHTTMPVLSSFADDGLNDMMADMAVRFIEDNFLQLAKAYRAKYQVTVLQSACQQSVGRTISKHCRKLSADAVIMYQHQQSLLQGLFCSSVSAEVASSCAQPTVFLKQE